MQLNHSMPAEMSEREGMNLSLEVIVATLADHSTVRYFVFTEDITRWEHDPDKIVMELLESPEHGIPTVALRNCLVHSTSWRFEPMRTIVLTYLVYTDFPVFRKKAGRLLSLKDATMAISEDPSRPRPDLIREEHVVTHGIRHVSHLVKERSQSLTNILSQESIQAFSEIDGLLAGRIG